MELLGYVININSNIYKCIPYRIILLHEVFLYLKRTVIFLALDTFEDTFGDIINMQRLG